MQGKLKKKEILQLLADFARAVLDDVTGEMLEYIHLIQIPTNIQKMLGLLLWK